jgi:hypothetical protein
MNTGIIMAAPTIESRLNRRCIVMSTDAALVAALRSRLPEGWTMLVATDLTDVGGFEDVLQNRFILLDLDVKDAFDPSEVLQQVRGDMMLNIAVFCFGGTPPAQEQARRARADRIFKRTEITGKLTAFCEQFGW